VTVNNNQKEGQIKKNNFNLVLILIFWSKVLVDVDADEEVPHQQHQPSTTPLLDQQIQHLSAHHHHQHRNRAQSQHRATRHRRAECSNSVGGNRMRRQLQQRCLEMRLEWTLES
jgi:hypothetical protein